jgi:hypothetical protein
MLINELLAGWRSGRQVAHERGVGLLPGQEDLALIGLGRTTDL